MRQSARLVCSKAPVVESNQPTRQRLGRSSDDGAVALPGDGAFQQHRMLGEVLQPFLVRARVAGLQTELLRGVFLEANQINRFTLQSRAQRLQRRAIERRFQVLDDRRFNAVFAQQGQGFPALAAAWVVQQLERAHDLQPSRWRCWRRPPSWVLKSLRRWRS